MSVVSVPRGRERLMMSMHNATNAGPDACAGDVRAADEITMQRRDYCLRPGQPPPISKHAERQLREAGAAAAALARAATRGIDSAATPPEGAREGGAMAAVMPVSEAKQVALSMQQGLGHHHNVECRTDNTVPIKAGDEAVAGQSPKTTCSHCVERSGTNTHSRACRWTAFLSATVPAQYSLPPSNAKVSQQPATGGACIARCLDPARSADAELGVSAVATSGPPEGAVAWSSPATRPADLSPARPAEQEYVALEQQVSAHGLYLGYEYARLTSAADKARLCAMPTDLSAHSMEAEAEHGEAAWPAAGPAHAADWDAWDEEDSEHAWDAVSCASGDTHEEVLASSRNSDPMSCSSSRRDFAHASAEQPTAHGAEQVFDRGRSSQYSLCTPSIGVSGRPAALESMPVVADVAAVGLKGGPEVVAIPSNGDALQMTGPERGTDAEEPAQTHTQPCPLLLACQQNVGQDRLCTQSPSDTQSLGELFATPGGALGDAVLARLADGMSPQERADLLLAARLQAEEVRREQLRTRDRPVSRGKPTQVEQHLGRKIQDGVLTGQKPKRAGPLDGFLMRKQQRTAL